ncbi:MAG: hypothetical protein H0X33_02740 [Taibaiella sp.]|nr:hypothetical protein [Taibaiella sp.]
MPYKHITLFLLLLYSSATWAQKNYDKEDRGTSKKWSYSRHNTIVTLSIGVYDWQRNNYQLADSYKHQYTQGFSPIYLHVEHAITGSIGLTANLVFDQFHYNYTKLKGFANADYVHYDKVVVWSAGLAAYYHFRKLFSNPKVDPFAGVGVSFSQVSHHYGLTDTVTIADVNPPNGTETTIAPIIKVGIRYYLDRNFSLYADAGYDKASIVGVGLSYRFW